MPRATPTALPMVVWVETVEAAVWRASRSDCRRLEEEVPLLVWLLASWVVWGDREVPYSCCMC